MTLQEFIHNCKGHYVDKYGKYHSYVQKVQPYGGQCASLARYYMFAVHGFKADSYGDAKDYINSPLLKKVNSPQNGDIIVWPYVAPNEYGGYYGHIGIYYKGMVLNQNPYPAQYNRVYDYGTPVFLRVIKKEDKYMEMPNRKITELTVVLKDDRMVYAKVPSNNKKDWGQSIGTIKKGTILKCEGLWTNKIDGAGRKVYWTRCTNSAGKFVYFQIYTKKLNKNIKCDDVFIAKQDQL